MQTTQLSELLASGAYKPIFEALYGLDDARIQAQTARYAAAAKSFDALFGRQREIMLFSAPGRTEVGGNHTDHQRGRVLAAAVNLDVIAVVSANEQNVIRIKSEGYDMDEVDLACLAPNPSERGGSASLIRGIAARFYALGYRVGGFEAYTTSDVLSGSGLSSSAAFEVLVGTILNHLYNEGKIPPVVIAQIGQYAENEFFGKPCGLMDQTASAVGGFVSIDFADPVCPVIHQVTFDLASSGYALCIVNTGGSHADLTADYAAVPAEMKAVAARFGKQQLREVPEDAFYAQIGALRDTVNDRAILRAIHFYNDNTRVTLQAKALEDGDVEQFLRLVTASGRSSFEYLQNVYSPKYPEQQGISLALSLSERVLGAHGAWRVHGGGFAGTVQAFVPYNLLATYKQQMERVFGVDACHVLSVRPVGGVRIMPR